MDFPEGFLNRMKSLLGDGYGEFLRSLDTAAFRALRINTLKANENVLSVLTAGRNKTPFCELSYYIDDDEKLGNHPYHHAGAFYLQEPSASSAVECLPIEKGDHVLDLCAAPGGKSTQLAAKLGGTGLLVSNEYVFGRVRPLISNLERLGVSNAVVTSLSSGALAEYFYGFFDKIAVDAPCSGEGMMRKEAAAINGWSLENIALCAARQQEIIDNAAKMLRPGGMMCYSTCTFAPEENEQTVARFLNEHTDFKLVKIEKDFGHSGFLSAAPDCKEITLTRRIFPFDGGEGHFVALLKRDGEKSTARAKKSIVCTDPVINGFFKENFENGTPENTVTVGDKVYITTDAVLPERLPVVRNGVFAGTLQKGRFVPEHSLFACPKFVPYSRLSLTLDDERVAKFLHGEEIICDTSLKGYTRVEVDSIPLGFGKASNGVLKNHYPKGLRILY